MSSSYNADCPCGFHDSGFVGGIRSTYMSNSQFPFYCKKDGLVSVNFREEPCRCPWCKSTDIKQYGKAPVSLPLQEGERDWPTLQAWNFQAYKNGHLCPKCKQMTLTFSSGGILLD